MSKMTVEAWLAVHKEAALKIDPETAEVFCGRGFICDPYGVHPIFRRNCGKVPNYILRLRQVPTFGSTSTICPKKPSPRSGNGSNPIGGCKPS
jgi:hypothetical protein